MTPSANIGLVFGAIGLAIGAIAVTGVLLVALRGLLGDAVSGVTSMRRAVRSSRRHKQELADARADARAELVKLGEEIAALDIDSSMQAASPRGKDEYSQAIDCYEEAERRLGEAEDDLQLDLGVKALRRGHEHVHEADRLFNPEDEPAAPLVAARAGRRSDIADELARLAALHDRGALTDAEFEAEKRKRLAR